MIRAITAIDEQAWVPIRYPNAIFDDDEQRWISDAEVAEIAFTAFTGRRKAEHVTARLIVRRVRRLNPAQRCPAAEQGELFAVYRYHAVFTDSREPMLAAEATHRDHAIIEQVIADLKNGPLAHLPSGRSPRTPPGWSAPRSPTTSPAPPAPSPAAVHARARTAHHPRPADQHPGPDRALRAPPSRCTYPATGPGSPDSTSCSATPCTTPSPQRPDHRPDGPDRRPPVEEPARPAASPLPDQHHQLLKINRLPSGTCAVDPG